MEYLVVDVDNRKINIPESITHLGVKDDNETRTLNFRMPKIYKGLDMSDYTIEINYINAKGKADSALAGNIQVGDEEITFQWCAGGTAYAKDGKVRFLVYTYLENEDQTKTNEWHTTWATLEVLDGGNVEEQIAEENPRIIEEMRRRIRDLENGEAGGTKDAIQYIEQELTDEQKAQARTNIGAASEEEVSDLADTLSDLKENGTGGSEVEISETEPTNENTDLWINPSDDEEVNIYTAEEVDEKLSKAGSAEVPIFDLAEMGLPAIPMDGTAVRVDMDTTELRDAFDKGVVKVKVNVDYAGLTLPFEINETAKKDVITDEYLQSFIISAEDNVYFAELSIKKDYIVGSVIKLVKEGASSLEIPTFNLVEMGLPIVGISDDTTTTIETDTTEIMAVLKNNGRVNVIFKLGESEDFAYTIKTEVNVISYLLGDVSIYMLMISIHNYDSIMYIGFMIGEGKVEISKLEIP